MRATCVAVVTAVVMALTGVAHAQTSLTQLPLDAARRVVASSPLTAELAARMAVDWAMYPAPAWRCETGLHTDALVSWHCRGHVIKDGKAADVGIQRTLVVDHGALVPLDLATQIASRGYLARMLRQTATNPECATAAAGIYVTEVGVKPFLGPTDLDGCLFGWSLLYPALAHDGVLASVARLTPDSEWEDDTDPNTLRSYDAEDGPVKPDRFVANPDDTVTDTATSLTWSAHDNGADIDHDGAVRYALAYRAGGHTDWRLPAISELVSLAANAYAHHEPGDCTRGKNQLVSPPLVHLSCGLVWASTIVRDGHRYTAYGFISGTARVAKPGDRKNYRVLMVRP